MDFQCKALPNSCGNCKNDCDRKRLIHKILGTKKLISHDLKVIVIQIPKCAGISLESAFGHQDGLVGRGRQDHRTICRIERPFLTRHISCGPGNRYVVTSEQYEEYTKLARVRNPWSQSFSWYENVIRNKVHLATLKKADDINFDEFARLHNGKGHLGPQT